MSYIRCLSNPEGLYIWGQSDGRVGISHKVEPPLSSKWPLESGWQVVRNKMVKTGRMHPSPPLLTVPMHLFHATCKQWAKYYGSPTDDRTSRGGLVVKEVHVFTDTGRLVPKRRGVAETMKDKRKTEFLIRFSYRGKFFHMWRVTWMYIIQNNSFRGRRE